MENFTRYAQPIDAHLFKDDDGTIYLYYGGWQHCNVAIMNDTMDGFIPHANGTIFKPLRRKIMLKAPACSSGTACTTSRGRRATG